MFCIWQSFHGCANLIFVPMLMTSSHSSGCDGDGDGGWGRGCSNVTSVAALLFRYHGHRDDKGTELRNVNSFTWSKFFYTEQILPQGKRANRDNSGTKQTKRMILEDKFLYQIGLVFRQKACISWVNLSEKAWFYNTVCSPKHFIPTCKQIYTDISVISMTFHNSAKGWWLL